MLQPSIVRSVVLLSISLCATLIAACDSREGERQSNTALSTPSPTITQSANSPARAKLNLNSASENDFLTTIPGMGKRMVHEFEEYRPYHSIQQFRKEMGKYVSPDVIAEYEKYVYVPISENDSDAATLQQIPGLDAAEAAALVAGRPYASREAFLAKLAEKVSPEELAIAKTYLKN